MTKTFVILTENMLNYGFVLCDDGARLLEPFCMY